MLIDAIKKAYETKKARGWDKIYIAVDIHDTITKSNYTNSMPDIIPEAISAIKEIQDFEEIELILWSSCYEKDYSTYMNHFKSYGLNFKHFNNNTNVENTISGDFSKKFYFNILIDDKAGFTTEDWNVLVEGIKKEREGNK